MKSIRLAILLFLLGSILLVSAIAVSRQAALSEKLIRLHVVANSDSAQDQAEKLRVRDAVLSVISDMDAQTRGDAERWLAAHLDAIERAAKTALSEEKCVRVTIAQEPFPTRAYDTFTLPAGKYLSLRVSIGDGQGRNWWCVVYPSLCTMPAASFSDTELTDSEVRSITDPSAEVRVEFKLLEWISEIF